MKYLFDSSDPLLNSEINRIIRRIPKDVRRELDRIRMVETRIERLEKQITEIDMDTADTAENLKETVKKDPDDSESPR